MPDLYLPPKRTTGVHLIAGIHRSPSKVGAVWDCYNSEIYGDGRPTAHAVMGTGTRIMGPAPEDGDMPDALLTLRGHGLTVEKLGFVGPEKAPNEKRPIGLHFRLGPGMGTGKTEISADFYRLSVGLQCGGGGTPNGNCDVLAAPGLLYFEECNTAFLTAHSQAMAFAFNHVVVKNCGVGFDMTGCELSVNMLTILGTEVAVVNRVNNPSVGNVFRQVVIQPSLAGKRVILFQQPGYGRSNYTFEHVHWPKGFSDDFDQPMVEVNHGARVVFLDSVLPAVNLVSVLDGGTTSGNAMPAVVEFHRCGFWSGWSPTNAFPMTQRKGKYRIVFADCYERETLRPFAERWQVIQNF